MTDAVEQTRGVEHPRGRKNGDVIHDHFAPMTWATCITNGCTVRVDPWDHNSRCPRHRPRDPDNVDVTAALATIPHVDCPRCGRRSYHPGGYCATCRLFTRLDAELSEARRG